MRIGLLSDTHIPEAASALPPELMNAFQGVDLILHAGDIYVSSVLDTLQNIAPVLAARGDDDYGDTLLDRRVKEKHILQLEQQTLWLIHQRPLSPQWWQSPWWQSKLSPGQDSIPDIVVFGHEHNTFKQEIDDILFISPGSPTFLHYRRGLGTIGILEINSHETDVNIVQL